ncbi:CGNR zinc finger domain-containing protein [Bacillus salacetis]|uniref:CGNR zinc finger domain-containing protein n=1 Tax=Bacillus salacetis TaxID=2315464 RepID=A0A3A1QTW9_9BACI|nr:CGNR zinc finger domain-containing protein [Bacillus salacetis]RIW31364.1 CGNR zinc finger domain-containing protein [Bacillus salacetis]
MNKNIETVLSFLNTWEISNRDRVPFENLSTPQALQQFIQTHLELTNSIDSLDEVRKFRSDLRSSLQTDLQEMINEWLIVRKIVPRVSHAMGKFKLGFSAPSKESVIDQILISTLETIEDGDINRIKSCPDCKYFFFDKSKSNTKKWCSMNKNSPTGRACGTIAKVRRHREKNKK